MRSFAGTGERELESPLGLLAPGREACRHPGEGADREALVELHCCRSGYLAALPELLDDIENRIPPEPDFARFPEERSCREAFRHGEAKAQEACGRNSCRMAETPCIPVRHLGCYHLGYLSHWSRNCDAAVQQRGEFERWARRAPNDSPGETEESDASGTGRRNRPSTSSSVRGVQ